MGTRDRGTYDAVEFSKKLASKSRLHITNSVRPVNVIPKRWIPRTILGKKLNTLYVEFEKIPILFT